MPKVSVMDLTEAKVTIGRELLLKSLHKGVLKRGFSLRISSATAMAGANLHAVGIGRKIVHGKVTKDRCIRFYVVQKIPASFLKDKLPEKIDGLPTDVIETPPAMIWARKSAKTSSCTNNRQNRIRPVIAGISAAHESVTAGTIACFCRSLKKKENSGGVCVLSNNHVFADVNNASPGDRLFQPGPYDGGTAADHFASLSRFVPIVLGGAAPNRVDGAIGELLSDVRFSAEVCAIGKIVGEKPATEDILVCKHGRTTGYTEGTVTDVSYDALIGMDHADTSITALFENQIRIEKLAPFDSIGLGGDSGSLIVEKTKSKAVGLYFAGPNDGSYGVANHIKDVFDELEVELL